MRYDSTAGQFSYNWAVPATSGRCYQVGMVGSGGACGRLFRDPARLAESAERCQRNIRKEHPDPFPAAAVPSAPTSSHGT